MNIVLTKERLMEILEDCFYKSGEYAITVPSFFLEQKFVFQIEKIEKYRYEIGCMLRRVKHERLVDEKNYTKPRLESEMGWFTMLGWLRYTKDDVQWCSIYDADCFCALGIAAGWLEVTQPKELFENNLESIPLHISLKEPFIKPAKEKKKSPWAD